MMLFALVTSEIGKVTVIDYGDGSVNDNGWSYLMPVVFCTAGIY